ncbi:MAG: hypothetical protein CMJ23_07545 [Phycisphaerae bacterium]|nr:hypothetical protein [Phycisphaerae bacterium]
MVVSPSPEDRPAARRRPGLPNRVTLTLNLSLTLGLIAGCEPASPTPERRATETASLQEAATPPPTPTTEPEANPKAPQRSTGQPEPNQDPASSRPTADQITAPDSDRLRPLGRSKADLLRVGLVFKGERFDVELASTIESRGRGMGGRKTFPAGTAMLFVNPGDRVRRYWMKNCLVDIDVAFIDRFGRITAMHRMPAEPPRRPRESTASYQARLKGYPSRRPARYALELPAGDLDRLGFRVGEVLPMPHAPLQATATAGP